MVVYNRWQAHTLKERASIVISQIHVYPVKSLGGESRQTACTQPRGLQHDRRWMVVDPEGRFLTQRTLPRMALLSARADSDALVLQAPSLPALRVLLTPAALGEPIRVRVWQSECHALAVSPDADRWLSDVLQSPCRLVYMPDQTQRLVPAPFRRAQGIVSFADAFPLLLASEASLHDLNERLLVPIPMNRFRPNIVVSGTAPYAEDNWQAVTLGETLFYVVKPCARCLLTTVDQATGLSDGPEPLRTLAFYRRQGEKVVFGQYLIPAAVGTVSVGMRVQAHG